MSDLISRKTLLADLEHGKSVCKGLVELLFFDAVMAMVDKQPTAYDVDKVIDQLSNKMFSAELYGDQWNGQTVNNLFCMGDVYEIIKGDIVE